MKSRAKTDAQIKVQEQRDIDEVSHLLIIYLGNYTLLCRPPITSYDAISITPDRTKFRRCYQKALEAFTEKGEQVLHRLVNIPKEILGSAVYQLH